MNTNLLHNVINVVIALASALTAFLLATGCTTNAVGAMECSQSWLNPSITIIAVSVLSVVKILMNILRDGLTGLIKVQPPVQR